MRITASLARLWGIAWKEFIQLRRDRLTFGMIVGIPIVQLLLFGFAINSDPKHLPMALHIADNSVFTRTFISSLKNTDYFQMTAMVNSTEEVEQLLAEGEVQFVLTIPADFSRQLVRGERPVLLLEADATDPAATSNALASLMTLGQSALNRDLKGPWQHLQASALPFEVRIHRRYNPEGITQYNIVPGLMGVILTMTLVLMTGLAMTRERERGTFENLLATPANPIEVMIGKIVPYILIGLVQMTLILLAAWYVFAVPFQGSLTLLYLVSLVFIAANLSLGMTLSTLARNQLQAMQMTFFFFLPSILLSGFMFPFQGMPRWAQHIGEILPLTHFLRIVRGIMLKGTTLNLLANEFFALVAILIIVGTVAMLRYRQTLD